MLKARGEVFAWLFVVAVFMIPALFVASRAEAAPPAPAALAPANGASGLVPFTILWSAVVDPAGNNDYNWQLSPSSSFTPLISSGGNKTRTCTFTINGNASISANVQ